MARTYKIMPNQTLEPNGKGAGEEPKLILTPALAFVEALARHQAWIDQNATNLSKSVDSDKKDAKCPKGQIRPAARRRE